MVAGTRNVTQKRIRIKLRSRKFGYFTERSGASRRIWQIKTPPSGDSLLPISPTGHSLPRLLATKLPTCVCEFKGNNFSPIERDVIVPPNLGDYVRIDNGNIFDLAPIGKRDSYDLIPHSGFI